MNIEFIKWMCEKAEGYHLRVKPKYTAIDFLQEVVEINEFANCESIEKSHLLTRAIEGVNREYFNTGKGIVIEQAMSFIAVGNDDKIEKEFLFDHKSITLDQAKESALKYIYEQETT